MTDEKGKTRKTLYTSAMATRRSQANSSRENQAIRSGARGGRRPPRQQCLAIVNLTRCLLRK
jgi:hypothetical protein